MILIGKKNNFAIEFEITKNNMGYAKIWFGNNSLGTFEDEIYIKGYLIEGLLQIKDVPKIDLGTEFENKEKLFMYLKNRLSNVNDDDIHKYVINLGTFCDDFTVFAFKKNKETNILWKLNNTDTPFSDLNMEKIRINFYKINSDEFMKLLEKYIKIILLELGSVPD